MSLLHSLLPTFLSVKMETHVKRGKNSSTFFLTTSRRFWFYQLIIFFQVKFSTSRCFCIKMSKKQTNVSHILLSCGLSPTAFKLREISQFVQGFIWLPVALTSERDSESEEGSQWTKHDVNKTFKCFLVHENFTLDRFSSALLVLSEWLPRSHAYISLVLFWYRNTSEITLRTLRCKNVSFL